MFLLIITSNPDVSLESYFLTLILPHITYPVVHIASTASTIMTVAIAHERYLAVQAPIVYSQMLKSAAAQRRRLAIYILPVFIFSILFNIPTFWCVENICRPTMSTKDNFPENDSFISNRTLVPNEDKSRFENLNKISYSTSSLGENYVPKLDENPTFNLNETMDRNAMIYGLKTSKSTNTEATALLVPAKEGNKRNNKMKNNVSREESDKDACGNLTLGYQYTEFRKHPYFIMFYQNLARLVVLGILPFAMLIFFNCSIYRAITRKRGKNAIFHFLAFYVFNI